MPRKREGFTLIELLIVVVIIGILAAIAVPKFADTKRKAHVANMKSDLKNMASAAEAHFAENNSYLDYMVPNGLSSGVQLEFVAAPNSWVGTAVHSKASGASCKIGVGTMTPTGLREGQVGGANCK
jgi:prepilin-type N-terminal cleavage/methylation domain-containing protein